MESSFRFRRQSCRPLTDVSVRLTAAPSAKFAVAFSDQISMTVSPDFLQAVVRGVRAACNDLDFEPELAVTIEGVTDNCGTSTEFGFKICGEAAMHHLLGFPERAPSPGVFPDGA